MSNDNRVIAQKRLPTKWPLSQSAIVYLLVDKFQPDQLWVGVIIAVMAIWWIITIYAWLFIYDFVDIFAPGNANHGDKAS